MFPVEKKDRVFGLDILRAAAILMVLVGHTWPSRTPSAVPGAMAFLGVELFFVLSGFLIGGILIRLAEEGRLNRIGDVIAFWRRRWFRTLPNYYLFLGLHLAWRTWVLGFPDQVRTNWEYLVFVQNLTHPPGFFFPETWSLAVEEWFYLLFPLLLFVALRCLRNPAHAWTAVIGLFICIPTGFRLWHVASSAMPVTAQELEGAMRMWDSVVRKIVYLRLDVVMYGVMGALMAAWRPKRWEGMRKLWLLGAVLVAIVAASAVLRKPLDPGQPWMGFALWPMTSMGFALLLPAFSGIPRTSGIVSQGISWVAKVSYALYLCHGLVILALGRWFGPKSAYPLPKHTFWWCVAAWVGSFVVAGVVYRWFEKPMMDLRDRHERQRGPGESGKLASVG